MILSPMAMSTFDVTWENDRETWRFRMGGHRADNLTMNVVRIQSVSTQDGPEIRTTVFLKGCNLNCDWCHNPKTINRASSLTWFKDSCTHCGTCIVVCPQKAIGPRRLSFGTGNERIKNNLMFILARGASVEIRIPVIGVVNDNEGNL